MTIFWKKTGERDGNKVGANWKLSSRKFILRSLTSGKFYAMRREEAKKRQWDDGIFHSDNVHNQHLNIKAFTPKKKICEFAVSLLCSPKKSMEWIPLNVEFVICVACVVFWDYVEICEKIFMEFKEIIQKTVIYRIVNELKIFNTEKFSLNEHKLSVDFFLMRKS